MVPLTELKYFVVTSAGNDFVSANQVIFGNVLQKYNKKFSGNLNFLGVDQASTSECLVLVTFYLTWV